MKHLNIEQKRPRIGVFDFTGCEGCQLQLTNKEETLGPFLSAIEVVNFREASSAAGDDYDVAIIDGAVSRADEIERLEAIREKAKLLVAMASPERIRRAMLAESIRSFRVLRIRALLRAFVCTGLSTTHT